MSFQRYYKTSFEIFSLAIFIFKAPLSCSKGLIDSVLSKGEKIGYMFLVVKLPVIGSGEFTLCL